MNSELHRPIVVGFHESAAARAALAWAADEAERIGSDVRVVYVSSASTELAVASAQVNPDVLRRTASEIIEEKFIHPLRERSLTVLFDVVVGSPATEIMRIAHAKHASIIVIGMTERGLLSEIVSSTTAHALRRHAVRPVVAVPAAWRSSEVLVS